MVGDRRRFQIGATWWEGQPVRVNTIPGLYFGVLYLENNPAEIEFTRGVLPVGWTMIEIPPPPDPFDPRVPPKNPRNPYPRVVDWVQRHWPADALYLAGVLARNDANALIDESFYNAPAGAPFHPLYAHYGRR